MIAQSRIIVCHFIGFGLSVSCSPSSIDPVSVYFVWGNGIPECFPVLNYPNINWGNQFYTIYTHIICMYVYVCMHIYIMYVQVYIYICVCI